MLDSFRRRHEPSLPYRASGVNKKPLDATRNMWQGGCMTKRKRGRPATGVAPTANVRIPAAMHAELSKRARKEGRHITWLLERAWEERDRWHSGYETVIDLMTSISEVDLNGSRVHGNRVAADEAVATARTVATDMARRIRVLLNIVQLVG